jgi:hypothetical protein
MPAQALVCGSRPLSPSDSSPNKLWERTGLKLNVTSRSPNLLGEGEVKHRTQFITLLQLVVGAARRAEGGPLLNTYEYPSIAQR